MLRTLPEAALDAAQNPAPRERVRLAGASVRMGRGGSRPRKVRASISKEARVRRPLVWVALAVLVIGGAAWWWLTRETPVAVTLASVEIGSVEATVANTRAGTVEACQRARMAPQIGGKIERLPVNEGDRVEPGEILLELWNDDVAAELTLAEREVEASRARAEEVCAMAEVLGREAERLVKLRRQGVASVEATEKGIGEATARRAACDAARTAARVAEARVDVARAALERTILRAPFAGIVAEINGEVGEFVTPSPVGIAIPPAVDLIDTSCLYVKAPIDEVDAAGVRPGQEARITLDAYPGRSFPARVRRIAPYVLDREKQARTVDVEVEFVDEAITRELLIGYSADAEIVLSRRDGVLRVPTEAVLEGKRVLVYDAGDGRLASRTFDPGLTNWQYTEVRDGLAEGDRVVVSVGREGVADGAPAKPEADVARGDTATARAGDAAAR
jgi:HlyD family secretion protein